MLTANDVPDNMLVVLHELIYALTTVAKLHHVCEC